MFKCLQPPFRNNAYVQQVEVLRRENGKVLKENSLLHMEIIRKDEVGLCTS
jgi:16S rRNA G966 N2-methylase RsmD